MNEKTSGTEQGFCALSLARIDAALRSTSGAMLTLEQFDEVTRLRRRIRQFCEEGREDEARRAEEMAMAILRPRHGR